MTKNALAFLLVLGSCSQNPQTNLQPALDTIGAESMLAEIKTLSSDEFEGRKPGSAGEQKTVAYMEDQFRKLGLKPGNPDGTFLQSVPLAGITSKPTVQFRVGGKSVAAEFKKDYVAVSQHYEPDVSVK